MTSEKTDDHTTNPPHSTGAQDLIPREFLRVLAVWSIVPMYAIAGAFLGWLADRWLGTSPWGIGVGLLLALILAVRDMMRLRDAL